MSRQAQPQKATTSSFSAESVGYESPSYFQRKLGGRERAAETLLWPQMGWSLTGNSASGDGARWRLNPYFTFFPDCAPPLASLCQQVLPSQGLGGGESATDLLTFTFEEMTSPS